MQEEKPEVIASGFSGKKLFGGSGAKALRIFLIAAGDMRGGGGPLAGDAFGHLAFGPSKGLA